MATNKFSRRKLTASCAHKQLSNSIAALLVMFKYIIILIFASFSSSHVAISASIVTSSPTATIEGQEVKALLNWQANLDNQNQSLFSSWVGNSPCSWSGISCNEYRSVIHINLTGSGLKGTLHAFSFSFFPNLLGHNLSNNSLYGTIPLFLGNLSKLIYLDLSSNQLCGGIPSEIGLRKTLRMVYLFENNINETIPYEIGILSSLNELALFKNNLTGSIPASIGSLGNLSTLLLNNNGLSGTIPQEIGMLKSLSELDLSINNQTGSIPTSIGNLANLTTLSLVHNNFYRSIPSSIGNLTLLNKLHLLQNQLSVPIPREVGNLRFLTHLGLFMSKLTGSIPVEMNNLTYLKHLVLSNNMLSGSLPQHICIGGSLETFTGHENYLTGLISISLRNCSSLYRFRFERNQLTGNISEQFGVYPNLNYIDLSNNNFYGELSPKWGQCQNLQSLKISNNRISGVIPPQLGGMIHLHLLDLSSNDIAGEIPRELERLTSLFNLTLADNELLSRVPPKIGNLFNLRILNLAANNLTGSIPRQLEACSKLQYLNLSKNRFRESIPFEIGNIYSLQNLDLSQNLLMGEIPPQLGKLENLETLSLSHNELSGSIPSNFTDMLSLTYIDISYNLLEGPLPSSKPFLAAPIDGFINHKDLCGNTIGLNACSATVSSRPNGKESRKVMILILVPSFGALFLIFSVVGFLYVLLNCRRVRNNQNSPTEAQNNNMFTIWSYDGKMVYENIIDATEEFDPKYCIGVGGYGSVYKVELPTGGSLGKKLSNKEEAIEFGWIKRINIVKGLAEGLSDMHHECTPPIVHRDISCKNILLDSEHSAHISNFGTAKVLNPNSSNWSLFAGMFGYDAPSTYFLLAWLISEQPIFGVMTLEVIMRKHPGDLISLLSSSSSSSLSSSSATTSTAHGILLKDVLDQRLEPPRNQVTRIVVSFAKLAFACLETNPQSRPTMQQISRELSIERSPLSEMFGEITLRQLLV
uniref:non-specific serine/threonine protein kinase n=1 Tax=Quercus lobata TaxID=97700 RepID=A0A7N2R137_QUELO